MLPASHPLIRAVALGLMLPGCVILGSDAHQERVDSLAGEPTPTDPVTPPPTTDTGDTDDTDDTDPPTPIESAPVLEALEWRFRYDDFLIHQGLQLMVRGSDADDDLYEIQIQGGETIAWSDAVEHEDGWFVVPLDLDLGPPCAPTGSSDLNVFLRDLAGNASQPMQLQISWTGNVHDESAITTSDGCEPCVDGLTTAEVPFVACGEMHNGGYIDFYDGIGLLVPTNSDPMEVVANYGPDAFNLRLGLTLAGDTQFIASATGDNDIGQTLTIEPPATPTSYEISIDGSMSIYDAGAWTVFVQPPRPGLAPR